MTLADVGTLDAALSAAIRGGPGAPAPRDEPLIGLEHEYQLLDRSGSQVDFREVIHGLPVQGLRLDPGDINAYRLTSGLALTCDEAEAEVVSPPVAVEPGFTSTVEGWAAAGRELLGDLLPPGVGIEGYSTHLSVAMPDHLNDAASELYAHTFAPALALMLERHDSRGIYVRPRPGRLELCGEYVDGPRLRATAAFAAGSVAACARVVTGDFPGEAPPRLDVRLLPGKERYGLRVVREAYGRDLYREGRDALLRLESGGTIRAQEVLELCWAAARASLQTSANAHDLDVAARMVSGALPLGIEGECPPVAAKGSVRPGRSPLGDLLALRGRHRFQVAPAVATWDFTVFRVEGARRVAYVNVPRPDLDRFLERLDAGQLDELLAAYLDSPPRGQVLASRAQVESPGLYDSLGDPTDLLAEEREPAAWSGPGEAAHDAARPGKTPAGGGARPGKRPPGMGRPWKVVALPPLAAPSTRPVPAPAPPGQQSSPQPTGPGRHIPWPPIAAAIALATVGLGFAAAMVFSNDTSGPATETPTAIVSTSPVPSAPPSRAPTDSASPTATGTNTATATATPTPTRTPDVAGGALTPAPTPTPTSTSTPTVRPTETPPPTATKFATETPRPTFTPTSTPTATPTPTKTIPPPTVAPTVAAGCTPSGGVVCK